MFLLGDFGVRVKGSRAVLTAPVRTLAFGDITVQGLPFYGGNVEYQIPVQLPADGMLKVEASRFRSPLMKAALDDGEGQPIAFAPYCACLKAGAGSHVLKLTAFGNRINTFGTLHNCNDTEPWPGPNAWRTVGQQWAYEYQIKPTGILQAPVVFFT